MKKELKIIFGVTLLILLGFLIKAIAIKNYEFIGYWVVLVALFSVVVFSSKKFNLPMASIVLFAIWSTLHMAGGLLKVGQTRLYDLMLIKIIGDPFFILKYDQVVHAFCYVAISILVYSVLRNYVKDKSVLLYFSILAGLGIGALNEIIEFSMVVFANAGAAVGGYYNNALDLVFNLVGAIIGSLIGRRLFIK